MRDSHRLARVPRFCLCTIALLFSLWSGLSMGLGFGTIKLYSYLNEPLDAEIELLGADDINTSHLLVTLAPAADFEKIHMSRPYLLTKLRFEVVQQADRTFISVQSDEPIKRAFLEFLVLLHWPEGRLVRSYTLLFDPAPIGKIAGRAEGISKPITRFSQDKLAQTHTIVHPRLPDLQTLHRNTTSALENLFETNHAMSAEPVQGLVQPSQAVSLSTQKPGSKQDALVDQAKVVEQAKIAGKALAAASKAQAQKEAMPHSPVAEARVATIGGLAGSFWGLMKLSLKTQPWIGPSSVLILMLGGLSAVYLKRLRPILVPTPHQAPLAKKPLPFIDQEFSIRMELAKHYALMKDRDSAKQVLETVMAYGNQHEKQAAQDLSDRLSLFE